MTDEPVHYPEAAALVGVSVDAVKQWKSRHRLDPVGWVRGRPVFLPDDVRAADEHARSRGGRPRKDNKAA